MPERTLVLGLGNPILRDDGVGWRVAEEAARRAAPCQAEFDTAALGGLALMERMVGYDSVILVDALCSGLRPPGALCWLTLDDLPTAHSNAVHDATLPAALALGRGLGARLPSVVRILAIEAAEVFDFGEELSPAVAAAVPRAVAELLAVLPPCTAGDPAPGVE